MANLIMRLHTCDVGVAAGQFSCQSSEMSLQVDRTSVQLLYILTDFTNILFRSRLC